MKNLFLLFTILLGLNSCNSWLDVQPYDRVAEDVVFESVKGFENALNGIYIELNTNSLYGQYLSCEMIEIMAQRYSVNKSNAFNYDLMLHKYTEQGCKAVLNILFCFHIHGGGGIVKDKKIGRAHV